MEAVGNILIYFAKKGILPWIDEEKEADENLD